MKHQWIVGMASIYFFCIEIKGSQENLEKKITKDDIYPFIVPLRKKLVSSLSLSAIQEEVICGSSDNEIEKKKALFMQVINEYKKMAKKNK